MAERRRWWPVVAGMAVLAIVGGGCSANSGQSGHHPSSQPSPSAADVGRPRSGAMTAMAGVSSGVMFGGDVPLATAESRLGRKLAIVRVYGRLGRHFGNPRVNQIMAGGTTVLASLDTFPGHATYADIAAGREDGVIKSWLNQVVRHEVACE